MTNSTKDYCPECIKVIKALEQVTPVGYEPFAWGPENECPTHYYVIAEAVTLEIGVNKQVSVTPICMVDNPQKRGG